MKVGQKVGLGTKIGNAGATGDATGPHVHFEEDDNGVTQKAVINGAHVPYHGHTNFTSHNKCGGGGGNPYTPSRACGSGYSVIDHHALGKAGTVYLAYKSSTGQNCVVTLKATNLKKKTAASAHIQPKGGAKHTDAGWRSPVSQESPRPARSVPIVVSSPWPVWTSVFSGRGNSLARMEAFRVGRSLYERPVAPGPPLNRVSPVKTQASSGE